MTRTRKVALAGAALLAAGGAGAALAATGHGTKARAGASGAGTFIASRAARGGFGFAFRHFGPGDDLQAAATYLGTTTQALLTQLQAGKTLAQVADATSGKSSAGLVAALVAAEKQELAGAVSSGKLTQAEADQISAELQQRITALVNGVRPGFPGGFAEHAFGVGLDAAATYLGTTTQALLAQLQSGKTLAQVADATSGKSSAGLIAALVAAEKQELAGAVSSGKLTQAEADQISADLQQRITDLVNGTMPAFHDGFGFGHFGPGDDLQAAATYLGTTTQALLAQLQAGKTLAQVADATSGKSSAGLVAALVAAEKQELAGAVSSGKLTQAQADRISADLQQRITDLVNGVRPDFGMHRMFRGWGGGTDGANT